MKYDVNALISLAEKYFNYIHDNFSGILAICAIFLTIYELRSMREHNRLSVRPFLTDNSHTDRAATLTTETLEIINTGIGPALIKKFQIFKDEKILIWNDHDDLEKQLSEGIPGAKITQLQTYKEMGAIPANERITILKYVCDNQNADRLKKIKEDMPKFVLKIEYESLYGDKFTYLSSTKDKK